MIVSLLWALWAGCGAVTWEWAARHPEWTWLKMFMVLIPAQIAVASGIYNVMAAAPRFLGGVLIFSGATWGLRVLISQLYFAEAVHLKPWIACGLVITIAILDRMK